MSLAVFEYPSEFSKFSTVRIGLAEQGPFTTGVFTFPVDPTIGYIGFFPILH
jgi:hypothetical protein